jgi:hypothetical protein
MNFISRPRSMSQADLAASAQHAEELRVPRSSPRKHNSAELNTLKNHSNPINPINFPRVVLEKITRQLRPSDILNLSLACKDAPEELNLALNRGQKGVVRIISSNFSVASLDDFKAFLGDKDLSEFAAAPADTVRGSPQELWAELLFVAARGLPKIRPLQNLESAVIEFCQVFTELNESPPETLKEFNVLLMKQIQENSTEKVCPKVLLKRVKRFLLFCELTGSHSK